METGTADASEGRYQFSARDMQLFRALSNRLRYLAVLLIILALLGVPSIVRGDALTALVTLLYAVTGVMTFGSAGALRGILTREGSDTSHLMAALGSLNNLLTVAVVLVTTLLAVGAGGILVAFVIATLQ